MGLLRSARTRLVVANACLGFLIVALVLGLVYWTVNRVIEAETRNVVSAELTGLAESYAALGMPGLARTIERRIANSAEPEAVYLLTDRFGQRIAGNLGAWPPTVDPGGGWVDIELIRLDTDRSTPISAASLKLRGGERLLVGRDASARLRFTSVLAQSVAAGLFMAVALSLVIGWLLTRVVFSRVGEVSDTAREIMSGDLQRRIPARADGECGGGGDEFDRLALTLNAMLDRIEALVSNLRMTTDSLAHDLRSPLTRLRGHIERLDQGDLTDEGRAQAHARALQEVDHVLQVFAGLTDIARADAGIGRDEFEPLDLTELARDVADLYTPVANEKTIALRVEGAPASVSGHKTLLSQAFSNLLENALRFAPSGTEITVAVREDAQSVWLSVADRGPGIAEADRVRVLDPFVTLDLSRTGGATGLGLALVASVARLHGGSIKLEDNAPGLRAVIRLPVRPS